MSEEQENNVECSCSCSCSCAYAYACKCDEKKSSINTINQLEKMECKCHFIWYCLYSIVVIVFAFILSCSILTLSGKISIAHTNPAIKNESCCQSKSSNSEKREKDLKTDSKYSFSSKIINRIEAKHINSDNVRISLHPLTHKTNTGILWLISFMVTSVLALIFSIPLFKSSRRKQNMQFILNTEELRIKEKKNHLEHHVEMMKEKKKKCKKCSKTENQG